MSKQYIINEIKKYLEDKRLMRYNGREFVEAPLRNRSLDDAITELEDYEDGIEAVTERNLHQTPEKEEKNGR